MPSFDKSKLLRNATPEQMQEFTRRLSSLVNDAQEKQIAWLESHNLPPDITRAVRLAMAEVFGDFVTADEIGNYAMSKIWELLQTAVDRRQWLAKETADTDPPFTIVLYFDEKLNGVWTESEVKFSNPSAAGSDYELSDEEESGFNRVVDFYSSGWEREIPERDYVAQWWHEFLRAPLRNVRIGTDDFRRSRAGLIRYSELLSMAEYANVESKNLGHLSVIELLELMFDRCSKEQDRIEAAKSRVSDPEANKKPEAPFLGLVFNHDSTVSRLGDDYAHLPPIELAPQCLKLLKFVVEARERGRTKKEIVPSIIDSSRTLTSEKNRLKNDLISIDIDLGNHGEYVARCTKRESKK